MECHVVVDVIVEIIPMIFVCNIVVLQRPAMCFDEKPTNNI